MYTLNKKQDSIINHLIDYGCLTTKQIFALLGKEGKDLSQAQVYNIVKAMIEEKILIKKEGQLELHQTRLDSLKDLCKKIERNDRRKTDLELGETKIYSAKTLRGLGVIWSDMSSFLRRKVEGPLYYYDQHPYHILGEYKTEKIDVQKFIKKEIDMFYLIGGTTFLDRYGGSLLKTLGCQVKHSGENLFGEGTIVAVLDDYCYTIQIPSTIYQYFEMFFDNIRAVEDFNPDLFSSIFDMKGNFKLVLTRDKRKSQKIKEKILDYF